MLRFHTGILITLVLMAGACGTDSPANANNINNANNANNANDANDANNTNNTNNVDLDTGIDDMSPADMGVDLESQTDHGNHDAATEDMPPQTGETCEQAIDVTAQATLPDQSTTGKGNDYDPSIIAVNCPFGSSSDSDMVFFVEPESETTYTFTVTPSGFWDPFIYVRDDCSSSACVAGAAEGGLGSSESLTVTVPAGVRYFVIVDGAPGSFGTFTFEATIQ